MKKGKESKGKKESKKEYKVLILDDEQKWHDEVKEELEKYAKEKGLKLNLIDAYNPKEGISYYEKNKPDLVISDVVMDYENIGHGLMSNKDGIYKFVKPIHEKYQKQKIIVMSSNKGFDIAVEAFNAGAKSFVQKQHLDKLREVLEEYEKKK